MSGHFLSVGIPFRKGQKISDIRPFSIRRARPGVLPGGTGFLLADAVKDMTDAMKQNSITIFHRPQSGDFNSSDCKLYRIRDTVKRQNRIFIDFRSRSFIIPRGPFHRSIAISRRIHGS